SLPLGRSILDHYVLALDIADLAQAFAELGQPAYVGFEWRGTEKRDYRHRRLLRSESEWPCRHAAKHRDELAPPHRIPLKQRIVPYHAEGCIVHHGKVGLPMSALGQKRTSGHSLYYLLGALLKLQRHIEAEGLGGL